MVSISNGLPSRSSPICLSFRAVFEQLYICMESWQLMSEVVPLAILWVVGYKKHMK